MIGTIRERVVEEVVRYTNRPCMRGILTVNPGECGWGDRVLPGRARVAGIDDNLRYGREMRKWN
ncbi:MAG: hypothetical protein KO173_02260 [Methanoregulaceae archaeon]|jgi:hypothetical protein|nr:hypothetical protein [Methanoregulaceae archaeon]MDD3091243.1 hypothetical protein [Methanoregulaceae archaeon]